MSESNISRILALFESEFGATDARIELGGREPKSDHVVWASLTSEWRVVLLYDAPPPNLDELRVKLEQAVRTLLDPRQLERALPRVASGVDAGAQLNAALGLLRNRANALRALVIDAKSPVIWACSPSIAPDEDVPLLKMLGEAANAALSAGVSLEEIENLTRERLAAWGGEKPALAPALSGLGQVFEHVSGSGDLFRQLLPSARAVTHLRGLADRGATGREVRREKGSSYLARSFSSIYWAILVYDDTFSELHAEASLVHALPILEQLVAALPPFEPPPSRAKVLSLPSRKQ